MAVTMSNWRELRNDGWYNDIGYQMQDEIRRHTYLTTGPRTKLDDPGWNRCTCGWQGYWCEFHPHVTDQLRELVMKWHEDQECNR
ncbi:hypothetical protein A7R75_29955 [Mycolicibacterium llatzerense]|nr:hypothetical protein [Mycolicibacterium llatzerense]